MPLGFSHFVIRLGAVLLALATAAPVVPDAEPPVAESVESPPDAPDAEDAGAAASPAGPDARALDADAGA